MSNLEKDLWKRKKSTLNCMSIREEVALDLISDPALPTDRNDDERLFEEYTAAKLLFRLKDVYYNNSNQIYYQTYYCPPLSESHPIMIFHHGAGSSAMSFWSLIKQVHKEHGYGAFLYDARGHGDSFKANSMNYNLSVLKDDFVFILTKFLKRHDPRNTLYLIGHSLGCAVFSEFLMSNYRPELYPTLGGLVAIDIVEEFAVRALLNTEAFFNRMPKSFKSYSEAVQWHLDSKIFYNYDSAKVSVYHLLQSGSSDPRLRWKCKVIDFINYWDTWFPEMSKKFIESTGGAVSKLLLLSTNDTLDKTLMIGQMQGKYQLVVFNNSSDCGHFLHEDITRQVCMSIVDFIRRIEITKKLRSLAPFFNNASSINLKS